MKEQASGNRQQAAGEQGSGIRDQASGAAAAMEDLLRSVVLPVDESAEPARDLLLLLRRRIAQHEAEHARKAPVAVPWYDWALAAGVVLMAVVSPVSVPVLLYYL